MNLKKTSILTALAVFAMWSCKETPISNDPKGNEEQKDDLSFSLEFKQKNKVSALLVDEYIFLDLKINDKDPEKNLVYILKPVGNDATKHQQLSKDYVMKKRKENPVTPSEANSYEIFDSLYIKDMKKNNEFVIAPKVAGTFKLNFELHKYDTIQKKRIGDIVGCELIFNVVKFYFDFPTWKTGANWNRGFKFKIYDGDREYDDYLQDKGSVLRHEYITHYDGQQKQGNFKENEWYEFRDDVKKWARIPKLEDYPQTASITIIQYLDNGTKNVLEYKDIRVY